MVEVRKYVRSVSSLVESLHIAMIVWCQQMAKEVMTQEVTLTHDHTSHCDTKMALQLRKTPPGNDGSSEITFARIAKTKRN